MKRIFFTALLASLIMYLMVDNKNRTGEIVNLYLEPLHI